MICKAFHLDMFWTKNILSPCVLVSWFHLIFHSYIMHYYICAFEASLPEKVMLSYTFELADILSPITPVCPPWVCISILFREQHTLNWNNELVWIYNKSVFSGLKSIHPSSPTSSVAGHGGSSQSREAQTSLSPDTSSSSSSGILKHSQASRET